MTGATLAFVAVAAPSVALLAVALLEFVMLSARSSPPVTPPPVRLAPLSSATRLAFSPLHGVSLAQKARCRRKASGARNLW